jgi:hypothetical protein
MTTPTDIDALDALHAQLRLDDGFMMAPGAAMFGIANAWPTVSAEVRALRARVAELEGVLEEIGKPDYGYMDIIEAGYPAEKHADYFARMVGWRRRTAHAALKKTFDGK